jgi:peptidoglycan/xylan/chitin deacetylase (PgdA/CDA1 family)
MLTLGDAIGADTLARMETLVRFAGVPVGWLVCTALRLTGLRAGVAVMFHRVGDPPGDYDTELVPNLGTRLFEAQVRYLKRTFRLVPGSELHDAALSRRRGEPFPAAITFDDDDPGHTRVSAPLLRRHGAPATFFLSGASLTAPFRFWWEVLQLAVDRGVHGRPEQIHDLAMGVQTAPAAEREALVAQLEEKVGPAPQDAGMRAELVRDLARDGFEIGFHTRRHEFLTILDQEALARAMSDGREELEEVAGARLDTIAYPHGGAQEREAEAARAAGFRWGYTTQAYAVTPASDPLLMGRVECSFSSLGHLALRLARALAGALRRSASRGAS